LGTEGIRPEKNVILHVIYVVVREQGRTPDGFFVTITRG
jgi:hypothetical protein